MTPPENSNLNPVGTLICGDQETAMLSSLQERYLNLMKRTLTHSLWEERTRAIDPSMFPHSPKRFVLELAVGLMRTFRLGLVHLINRNSRLREMGEDWPEYAHAMVGLKRLDNIQDCVARIVADHIPGDLIETGVWRGGAVIFMAALLKTYSITDRK